MRIVIISDTHGKHEELGMLHGDVLIHCGDFCNGYQNDGHSIAEIDRWFGMQQFELILTIGGNHDFLAESLFERSETVFENASYLVDTEYIHKGVTFYGSPWLPDLDGWANYLPDKKRQKKWERIPASVDVLITHTPPFGILDRPRSGRQIGCKSLRSAVDRVRPQVHCFGHVHASPGRISKSWYGVYQRHSDQLRHRGLLWTESCRD